MRRTRPCTKRRSGEHVGVSQDRITVADPAQSASAGNRGAETHATWAAAPPGAIANWLVGFNGQGGASFANLGRAADAPSLSWTFCDLRGAAPNGCGPAAGPVPWASGAINGTPITQVAFGGDPYLASTRRSPEVAVYTNIGSSNWVGANPNDMVVAAFSWDGGQPSRRPVRQRST